MAKPEIDEHFLTFGASLEALLATHVYDRDGDKTTRQKSQVEKLIELEKVFRETLISDYRGPGVYKSFVKFIVETRRNILDARPFFRERQETFKGFISPALRLREDKTLYQYNINWQFIAFALRSADFSPKSRVRKAADAVHAIREELIQSNIPLAISRARIFRGKTQRAHLTYMDLVQISSMGLIAAVDKFVLPYSPVFRSVIIGRAVGDLISSNSETLLHFFPSDRSRIYRSHKANRDPETPDWQACVDAINIDSDEKHKATIDEVQVLMLAASHISMDATTGNDEVQRVHDSYAADESSRPDLQVEAAEVRQRLYESISSTLNVFERKVLSLKGLPV